MPRYTYLIAFLLITELLGQTAEQPARAVTDPGVVTTRQTITPAGVPSIFQGRVYGVAFGASPDDLWVLNAGHIYQLDWRRNRIGTRIKVPGTPGLQGIGFDPVSRQVFVSGADRRGGKTWLGRIESGALKKLSEGNGNDLAGGLSIAPGKLTAVPLTANNRLEVADAAGRVRTFPTGIAPFAAVVNRDGTVAYVSNWGGRIPRGGDLTAPTGLEPNADRVVIDARGVAATGSVTRIDLEKGAVTDTIEVQLHPTALAWDESGNRLYVANSNSDSISVIDTAANRLVRHIALHPFDRTVAGIAPTALALSADAERLFVACGGINAIAQIRLPDGELEGLIPTAWYPNSLTLSPDGQLLAVGTLLGAGSGWRDEPRQRFVHSYRGSVAVIPLPGEAQLASYTRATAENNHLPFGSARQAERRPAPQPIPIPTQAGDPSLIEHVVYIIKENRTYDQVFGDMPKGNGDPSLVMFGEKVTPNHHRLADRYVLLDNFYATGGNSADGHQWLTQANEVSYALWPGYAGRSYPFDGSDPIAYSASGFLWDHAIARGKTVRVYGEYAPRLSEAEPRDRLGLLKEWEQGADFASRWTASSPIPSLERVLVKNYPSYTNAIPDVVRASILIRDIRRWEQEGKMPNLVIAQLPCDHTFGTRPGTSTPAAMVADNDLAVGRIVEALTATQFWKKMAIFVVEDDAQNGVDHVDGHRTVALVVSPYARRDYVDSTFYSDQSMLKTIELILGLPAMTLFDLIATEMRASFTDEPDFTPYKAVRPEQSLWDINPEVQALRGKARQAARDSLRMRFDIPDAAPTERLNRILWGAIRGWKTPYPGSRNAVFAPLALDLDDDEREVVRGR